MDKIANKLAKEFFESKPEIIKSLEIEFRVILVRKELPFTLQTFKAMMVGMDLFSFSAKLENVDDIKKRNLETSYHAMMYVQYLIAIEEDKLC